VRGFADQRLRKPDAPQDLSNRRISFIVQYRDKTAAESDQERWKTSRLRGSRKNPWKKPRNPVLPLVCLRGNLRKPSRIDESQGRTD
jgi:hypothetical protein